MTTSHTWPKAVLFDLDDTLWPIAPVIDQAEQTLFAWLAAHAPRLAARHTIDSLRQARLTLLAREPELGLDLARLRELALLAAFKEVGEDVGLVKEAMQLFAGARNAVTPFDDVVPALTYLQQHVLLGSVTNGVADLHAIGLAHHFQASVSAREFGRAKPDAGIFHAACSMLGVAPREALYVGDDLRLDVQGAQQAGLRAVWINRLGAPLEGPVRPDAQVRCLSGLIDWLGQAPGPLSRNASNCL